MKQLLTPTGYAPDLPPWATDRWTAVSNMFVRDGYIERVRGEQQATDSVPIAPEHLVPQFDSDGATWVIAGSAAVFAWGGTDPAADITGAWAGTTGKGQITSGVLNTFYPILNREGDAQPLWTDLTAAPTALVPVANAPRCATARVPFSNFIVCLDTAGDSSGNVIADQAAVAWSSPTDGDPNSAVFAPAADNLAGSVLLGDTLGRAVDVMPLRQNVAIVAKDDALYSMAFVGGQSVYQFTRLHGVGSGVIARNCLTPAFEGVCYGLSSQGPWASDGSSVKAIGEERVWRTMLSNLADDPNGSFVALDPTQRQVLFCPLLTGNWPTRAYVFSIDSGEWGERELTPAGHIAYGINASAQDDTFDGGPDTTFDGGADIPFDTRFTSPTTKNLMLAAPEGNEVRWLDLNADGRVGSVVKEFNAADGDAVLTARRVWLDAEIPPGGLTVALEARFNDSDSWAGGGAVSYGTAGRWASIMAKGRQFRVEISGAGLFSVQRVGIEYSDQVAKF